MAESEGNVPTTNQLIAKFKEFMLDNNQKDTGNEMKSVPFKKMMTASLKVEYGSDITNRTDTVFTKLASLAGSKASFTVNKANVESCMKQTALAAHNLKTGKSATKGEVDPPKEVLERVMFLIGDSKAGKTNNTKISNVGGVGRLTDTSKYTGTHGERFDKDGKGKGKDGREDAVKNDGYVGNYKEKDTYASKH